MKAITRGYVPKRVARGTTSIKKPARGWPPKRVARGTTSIKKPARGWPMARRKAQAERIRKTKPWLKATGPKTKAGKIRSSKNAWKHGFRSRQMNEIYRLLRWQKAFTKQIQAKLNNGTYGNTLKTGRLYKDKIAVPITPELVSN